MSFSLVEILEDFVEASRTTNDNSALVEFLLFQRVLLNRQKVHEWYLENAEYKKAWQREYAKRPDVAERIREYNNRPERLEAQRKRSREYHRDPAVRERLNARRRLQRKNDPLRREKERERSRKKYARMMADPVFAAKEKERLRLKGEKAKARYAAKKAIRSGADGQHVPGAGQSGQQASGGAGG